MDRDILFNTLVCCHDVLYLERVTYDKYQRIRDEKRWAEPLSSDPVVFNREFPLCNPVEDNYWCFIRIADTDRDPIIGTLSYRHTSYLTKIRDVEIRPAYRGKGYGTLSLLTIIDQAKQRGSFLVWLFVFENREAARYIYNKLGFDKLREFDHGKSLVKNLVRSGHIL